MGVVYRALDPRSGRRVALKLLHDTSERFRARFQREAELLARLRHPHVVGVHGAGEVAGKPYLVMELIEGESLRERIQRRGRLSDRDAARLTAQVARGAGHAHAAGLVHRDIKPGNVLLTSGDEGERALLTDFGLARDLAVASDLSKTGVFLGTPGYASPEQAAGQRDRLSPASDVYGLGGLLYDALTGSAPNEGSNLLEVLCATLDGPVPSPRARQAEVHPDLDAICRACLAKDPGERYRDGDDLAEDLERFLRGEPPRGIPKARSRRSLSLALVALGVLSSLALGGALWGGEDPGGPPRARPARASPAPTSTTRPPNARPAGPARPARPDSGLAGALRLTARLRSEADELGRGIRLLEEALERCPREATNRPEGEDRLAQLYAARADLKLALRPHEAVSDLRRAYALDASPARRVALGEAVLQSGLVHSSQSKGSDAWVLGKPLLEEAVRLLPGDHRPNLALAEQARIHREFETALRGFRETVRLDPLQRAPYAGVLSLCARDERWAEARQTLEGWARDHPEVALAHVTLGDLHQRRARFQAARQAYERALELDPEDPAAHVGLGFVAIEEARPSAALEHAARAAPRARGDARDRLLALRGVAHCERGELDEGLPDLEAGLRCQPLPRRVAESYLNALHWIRGGAKELAALQEKVFGDLRPGRDKMLWAGYYWRRGEQDKAFAALREGRRRDPADPEPCLLAARWRLSWGKPHDPRKAMDWVRAGAGVWSDDEEARYLVEAATACVRVLRYAQAERLLAAAKREHPTLQPVYKHEADLANRREDYPRAIQAGLRSLELEPQDAYAMAVLADAYMGSAQPEEALRWLTRAHERIPANGAIIVSRGLARFDTGDLQGARADLERAQRDAGTRGRHEFKLLAAHLAAQEGELPEDLREQLRPIAREERYRWARARAAALLRGD